MADSTGEPSATPPRLLFDIVVPGPAVRVEIRPIFGQGNTCALYNGALADLSDSDVMSYAAKNASFWDYVDAQVRGGRLQRPKDGMWSWQLRLKFYDQAGNASDSIKTESTHEFYKGTTLNGGGAEAEGGVAAVVAAASLALNKVADGANNAIAQVATAAAQLAAAGATAAGQIAAAGAAPAVKAIEALIERSRDDCHWRDDAMGTIGDLTKELRTHTVAVKQEPGSGALDVLKFVGELKNAFTN